MFEAQGGALTVYAAITEAELDRQLATLERMPAGVTLAAALEALPDRDDPVWLRSADSARARVVALWDRVTAWSTSRALDQFAAEHFPGEDPEEETTIFLHEVALETHSTLRAAENRYGLAIALERCFPRARQALSDGRLSLAHIRALDTHAAHLGDSLAPLVDAVLTPRCLEHGWTPSQFAAAVRRAVLQLQRDGGQASQEAALDDAAVRIRPQFSGTATLLADGEAVTITQIMAAVDRRADELAASLRGGGTDEDPVGPPPIGRLRFAALADLVLGEQFILRDYVLGAPWPSASSRNRQSGRPGRGAVQALVRIDLPTLVALNEAPADLDGYGPIPAHLARLVASQATLRRLVTEPLTAHTIDLGRTRYPPSDPLADFVRARDHGCRFPGCTRRVALEIDHITPYAAGGGTDRANLHLLCRRHHRLKTKGIVECTRGVDGEIQWRFRPSRRRYRSQPPASTTRIDLHPPPEIALPRLRPG